MLDMYACLIRSNEPRSTVYRIMAWDGPSGTEHDEMTAHVLLPCGTYGPRQVDDLLSQLHCERPTPGADPLVIFTEGVPARLQQIVRESLLKENA